MLNPSDTIPVPRSPLELVREMRHLQRAFAADGSPVSLAASKVVERTVERAMDCALAELDAPQGSLFEAP